MDLILDGLINIKFLFFEGMLMLLYTKENGIFAENGKELNERCSNGFYTSSERP